MIIGIGTDLIDVRRIEKSLERHGERFVQRIFTEAEQARAEGRAGRACTYAKRFAAKEACAKALGCGIADGVFWRDMSVVNDEAGRPRMELSGGALTRLSRLMPPSHTAAIHLTMTDDYPYAQAFVIIEALPVAQAPQ